MAHWDFYEIGISVDKSDIELKKQFLDCIGYENTRGERAEDPYYGDTTIDLYDGKMIYATDESGYCAGEEYYAILNQLFPKTYLHDANLNGTSVTTCWNAHQYLYDPVKNIVTEYLAGEFNDDCVGSIPDWCDGEIYAHIYDEEKDDYEEVECSYREFYEMSDEKQQEIEESCPWFGWSGQRTIKYKSEKINKELVREILDESVKKGYVELSALIMDKCKDYLKIK